MKRRATLAALLTLASAALAADLPDAPTPQPKPPAVYTRQLWTATAAHAAIRFVDDGQTCKHLANGGREYSFPTQSCAGVIGFNAAWFAGITFVSYELAKHGKPRAALALQYLGAASDLAAVVIPRKQVVYTKAGQ